jgi:hypothetical protein
MADFGFTFGGDARRAHLALVQGGASISTNATSGVANVARPAASTRSHVPTAYASAASEAPRSRHESGVRAVARTYDNFDDALLPMVLASGVSGEAAASVAEAIKGNPALRAQAERAFQRARLDAV